VKKTLLQRIWHQVANVLVGILVTVAVVSAIRALTAKEAENKVTNWLQVALITLVITVNTYIGILQEGNAEKAAEALKAMLSSDATVLRDGEEKRVPANEVVPGDLVVLSTGDSIPADMRLIKVTNLSCLEAPLTGESVPVEKITEPIQSEDDRDPSKTPLGDRVNLTFSATLVSTGSGIGIVIYTGDNTEIGTINALVNKVEEKKTAVLEQIDFISKWLAVFICITALITFLYSWLRVQIMPLDSLSIALTCAVAMIPEGLEAIVTLTYAWAVSNMAKQNAIIRALPAVETLGSVTVICSDKTGTLTKNEMTLVAFVTAGDRYQFASNVTSNNIENVTINNSLMTKRAGGTTKLEEVTTKDHPDKSLIQSLLSCGIMCTKSVYDGEKSIGNPTEIGILKGAYKAGIDVVKLKKENPIIAEVPFNSEYKFMATVHDDPNSDKLIVYAKGAPDKMVPLCKYQGSEGDAMKEEFWQEQISILSSYGLRVIALCEVTIDKGSVQKDEQLGPDFIRGRGAWLTMVGLCAIMDPPRPECVDAIKVAHLAGVRVAMITGDHKETALAIGRMLGIVSAEYPSAVTGSELDDMSNEDIASAVMVNNIFARATPENKIQIVKALQAQGQVASMTGDGVNDAPALKAADMGVAMGIEGTDVAREASEMILADDNFATIVVAVKEGRVVWDNLRKVLLVNTPINNAQGLSVLFGMICGLDKPILSPIQVLYCNLICAVTLGFVTAVEPPEDGVMDLPPRRVGKRLIGRFLFLRILLGTIVLVVVTVGEVFIARDYARKNGFEYSLGMQRSLASNALTIAAIGITASARFAYNSAFHPRFLTGNKFMWYSTAIVILLQLAITYIPGLNMVIFSMDGQDGFMWMLVIVGFLITFFVMEAEKALRRSLKAKGIDTTDSEIDELFDEHVEAKPYQGLPKGYSRLKLVSLKK